MLTKNFYALLHGLLSDENATFIDASGTSKAFSANAVKSTGGYFFSKALSTDFGTSNRNSFPGVRYGTGNSPASVDDIKLAAEIPSQSLNVTMPGSSTINVTNTYIDFTTVISLKNLTAADIPLSEIALFIGVQSGSSTYSYLVDRTVLDEPVTIPAGQSKQITYTIRFNYGA